jgi:3-aminobutyryl-CoA ammonia-lyase
VEGLTVEIRVRLSAAEAHYGGNLVDGAHGLELFGDVVTELAIRTDGDEGLFAGYERVEFLAPLYAGDFVSARGTIVRTGRPSRTVDLEL